MTIKGKACLYFFSIFNTCQNCKVNVVARSVDFRIFVTVLRPLIAARILFARYIWVSNSDENVKHDPVKT